MTVTDKRAARFMLVGAGVAGALAVAMGAFGAHALKSVLSPKLSAVYQTAVDYHFIHALLLLGLGLLMQHAQAKALTWLKRAAMALVFGLFLFCGSLYGLALSGLSALGWLTPFGGLAFIVAWLFLATAVWHNQ